MGQIANDIIDGYCCSLCGTYFTKEHGYPVVCKDCWKSLSKKRESNINWQHMKKFISKLNHLELKEE